jgi:hypothetical protein
MGGCASTTNFANSITGYSGQAKGYKEALDSGVTANVEHEINSMEGKCQSPDKILYLSERGRLRSLIGDKAGSTADYLVASDTFENERMKAVISASDTLFAASSLASNDLAIPYEGYAFEKVMLHNMQAINYILASNYDFARIELNRADVEQSYQLDKHAKIAAEAEAKSKDKKIDLNSFDSYLTDKTSQDVFGTGSVKNSFQNAFTFFLRGCMFEDSGEYDKALIEYKKALEIFPANNTIAESAMRTANLNDDARQQQQLTDTYGTSLVGNPCPDGSGRLVIVFEKGFIASRSTFRVPFIWDNAILQLVLPYYDTKGYAQPAFLETSVADKSCQTQTICNLEAMAVQSLKEEYPSILLRQALRMIAKYQMQKEASKQSAGIGLLMKVANIVTDRADDRNWLTLPEVVQVGEIFLPAGDNTVTCRYIGLSCDVDVDIKAGQTHYLIVTQLSQKLLVQGSDIVEAPAGAPVQEPADATSTL